ncbi:MAG: serine hydroxymethyltransferase [Candidatus Magasanikbacteria bacterium]|jgi:glycine hydroxymethyltransferase|nr:serine hydroxymethyltransferase [Candidatus Magasanikbacteria bacterium]MBT4221444.1 serine hydroxymethyltransferase [Candidatus Magasanikbacteria bacterium]MBT4350708.1 serine hydroxymethyltransferase [Candidatus Magasanikbacteria bacterium]MBT4541616.1 serine hydroxymethyltransferase [Candidatus Magasanikbacteria bacterium]MBT6252941.1 serine hydroxymethyltransferase [Candidatus Magasanikbacteria bacterium]
MNKQSLKDFDPVIANAIKNEINRQESGLEMIPSENFVSIAALEALGSVVTNKYSEGYPGKRYYGGCEHIDTIEQTAIDRAKELFGAEHVNIQPLSGAPMNVAVYFGLLEPGDTILGMDLSHGGHLTHGHPVTHMAKIFNFIRYKTNQEGNIDLDNLQEMANTHKPKMILVGYSAYSRDIDYENIKRIADSVGAITMADVSHIGGLIAGGEMNNPVPLFDVVTTTTHKTLRGARGGMIMCKEKYAKKIDKAVFPGLQGGPHENNIAASAVAFKEAQEPAFKEYCKQIKKNAKALEIVFKEKEYKIMFGGTSNHLLLIDVTPKGITGKEAQQALDKAGITINKNMIPDDPRRPMDPSGIRLGTPALTTRGMKEKEMEQIAHMIDEVIMNHQNDEILEKIKQQTEALAKQFPLYPELQV